MVQRRLELQLANGGGSSSSSSSGGAAAAVWQWLAWPRAAVPFVHAMLRAPVRAVSG